MDEDVHQKEYEKTNRYIPNNNTIQQYNNKQSKLYLNLNLNFIAFLVFLSPLKAKRPPIQPLAFASAIEALNLRITMPTRLHVNLSFARPLSTIFARA